MSARSCLVLRHVAFEGLGALAEILPDFGFETRLCEIGVEPLPTAEIAGCDLLVALGGPIGVYETEAYPFLVEEISAIAARLRENGPTLGICLGAQLMAAALGAKVAPGPAKEIGYAPLSLTEAGRASPLAALAGVNVLHWHGDNFELPEGAQNLAFTSACPHQAFALGSQGLALQFHAEVEPAALEAWLIGHTVELGKAGIDPREIRAETARFGAATAAAGKVLFRDWLEGVFA
ncbi:glutamine amidotransferase [uncultured Rhodoblastus sp.]|uniref:glutamine amidotransferase n=1 Tax=uncultured Rhodoblastus sp. TaxID=543037 RepID=UPI0025FA0DDC|nr:glutamine amidotransferase [uncultured Rhodoblastus sp.]